MRNQPVPWTSYPVRTCYSLHTCKVCGQPITIGQLYHDGGYGRRAHVDCLCPCGCGSESRCFHGKEFP